MADLKQQIFQELTSLEEAASRLRGMANDAGRQTDLEVAVLNKQVKILRDEHARAAELIDQSISILENLS
ncbi:MAG: hypothetical protein MJ187_01565 [Alphaproteobacteria bacterium]|nr:hypothetical protein [Alphaproteobacteria bacterium]